MKTKTLALLAAATFLPIGGFAQTPPAPPVPPAPPAPPAPGSNAPGRERDRERGPKVPVTWLGVETSSVPNVVSDQLGLAKGFGLVVDYVVPEGPAAAGGLQANDILKMLNDQILTEPGQLAKLVRSFSEGTSVTLTVLRKGAEQKISVKLAKHDVPQRKDFFGPGFEKHWKSGDFGMTREHIEKMLENVGDENHGMVRNAMETARAAVRSASDQARQAGAQARRAADEVRRQARQIRVVTTSDDGAVKSTKIDIGKSEIVMNDDKGELKVSGNNGQKILTAKDTQGKLLFSGTVDSKEDLDKVPADVRARYEKLEQRDLAVAIPATVSKDDDEDTDVDVDDGDDSDDNDNDDAPSETINQVAFSRALSGFRFQHHLNLAV